MDNITFREFYQNYFTYVLPDSNDHDEIIICCPFHDDNTPSFSINETTGLWKCFGSCDEGGDVYTFYERLHGVPFTEAKKQVDNILGDVKVDTIVKPIKPEIVDRWHRLLISQPTILSYLINERGLSRETIDKYQIGWDGGRLTFPILDKYGLFMNVRRYNPADNGHGMKLINFKTGYGRARLYPLEALTQEVILINEGETDMYLARQLGLNSITATGGAGTWLPEWNEHFKDKTVFICYDIDASGRTGAAKVAKEIATVTKQVYFIDLPITEPRNADFTDYIIKHGHTVDDFKALMKKGRLYVPPKKVHSLDDSNNGEIEADEVTLFQARQAKYRDKRVKMRVLVVGKDLAPYTIPRKMKFTCTQITPENKLCQFCAISNNGGEALLELPPHPNLLNLIRCSDLQQRGFLRQWGGIPKCDAFVQEIIEPQNIEELLIAPELSYEAESETSGENYTLQRSFFIADNVGAIRPNQSYLVEGSMTPDPWQQYVTFVLKSAKPLQDSIAGFAYTKEVKEQLKAFRLGTSQTIKEKFDEIHNQFSHNITHIFGRNDLLTALDLVFHSALHFNFQNVSVNKGWLECLIIGDTRTGKSESTERMMQFYRLGEMVFGENTSFSGLVGGMQQTQNRWFITWGKIPLNDKRLVVVDEASGLSTDDFAKMSGIRSSGIAEITKIQTEKALARTRLIWISNPRSGRSLKTYGYGVEAVSELIGKSEDVARFDFVVSAASEEIPTELINQLTSDTTEIPLTYTATLCRNLVLWAWSRKADDISFTDDATKLILEKAIEMGKKYSTRVPLVEPANQRIKIARLAVATAIRLFNTDETCEKVIVTSAHVEFAVNYLNEIYSKPSFDYAALSRQEKDGELVAEKNVAGIRKFIEVYCEIADIFIRQNITRSTDLEEQLDMDKYDVKQHIHRLATARMIERTPHGYKKTPAFIKLLREWKSK